MKTITRTLERELPDRTLVVATVQVRAKDGPLSPCFSITGEVYYPHGTWSGAAQRRNGREPDACGQVVDEIREAFPHLEPLLALHLSDSTTGEPTHAEANGWYYYGGDANFYNGPFARGGATSYDTACRLLRVESIPTGLDREGFAEFVNEQRPRWREDAEAGRELARSLPE